MCLHTELTLVLCQILPASRTSIPGPVHLFSLKYYGEFKVRENQGLKFEFSLRTACRQTMLKLGGRHKLPAEVDQNSFLT